MPDFLWFDTETTGTDKATDEIHQLGAIPVANGRAMDPIDIRSKPSVPINPEAARVTGVTQQQLDTYPDHDSAVTSFVSALKAIPFSGHKIFLAGYNIIDFDRHFFKRWFVLQGQPLYQAWFYNYAIDPYPVVQALHLSGHFPGLRKLNLSSICRYLGIDLDNAHDAVADIRATRHLWFLLNKRFSSPR